MLVFEESLNLKLAAGEVGESLKSWNVPGSSEHLDLATRNTELYQSLLSQDINTVINMLPKKAQNLIQKFLRDGYEASDILTVLFNTFKDIRDGNSGQRYIEELQDILNTAINYYNGLVQKNNSDPSKKKVNPTKEYSFDEVLSMYIPVGDFIRDKFNAEFSSDIQEVPIIEEPEPSIEEEIPVSSEGLDYSNILSGEDENEREYLEFFIEEYFPSILGRLVKKNPGAFGEAPPEIAPEHLNKFYSDVYLTLISSNSSDDYKGISSRYNVSMGSISKVVRKLSEVVEKHLTNIYVKNKERIIYEYNKLLEPEYVPTIEKHEFQPSNLSSLSDVVVYFKEKGYNPAEDQDLLLSVVRKDLEEKGITDDTFVEVVFNNVLDEIEGLVGRTGSLEDNLQYVAKVFEEIIKKAESNIENTPEGEEVTVVDTENQNELSKVTVQTDEQGNKVFVEDKGSGESEAYDINDPKYLNLKNKVPVG